jgi:hypothetical protein
MTTKTLPKIGYFNGRECDIVSRSGGWTEILDHDGKRRKVRNGEISWTPGLVAVIAGDVDRIEAPKPAPKATPTLSATIAPVKVEAPKAKRQPHNGDEVARMLEGTTLAEVYAKASHLLCISESELLVKYGHLNPGQQRMNLGNRLRGYYRKLGTL